MRKFNTIILFCSFVLVSFYNLGQQSIGFGVSSFHSLGLDMTRWGLNLSYEAPRNEVNTFFLRTTFSLPKSIVDTTEIEKDFNVVPTPSGPAKLDVQIRRKTTLHSIEGGTRYYLVGTYDAQTALYGGFHMRGFFATYKEEFAEKDFEVPEGYQPIQRIPNQYGLLMSFGANIGVKYQLPMGNALTFDIVGDLIRPLYDPAVILGNEVYPLAISFNLSYRFDRY